MNTMGQGGELAGNFVGGVEVGINQLANGALDLAGEFQQDVDHGLTIEGLTLTQAYREGWLDICYLVKVRHSPSLISGSALIGNLGEVNQCGVIRVKCQPAGPYEGKGKHFSQLSRAEGGSLPDQENEPVLVTIVECPNTPQVAVPCSVWFEVMDRFNDLFAGKPYLSIVNGAIKAFGSLPGEGKLDLMEFAFAYLGARHGIDGQVKGRPQIMDRVPDNKPKFIWNGFLCFDSGGGLPGLRLMVDEQREWFLGEKGFNSPVEVVDVVLGPLDFQRRPVN
jgi:hypothetical protein